MTEDTYRLMAPSLISSFDLHRLSVICLQYTAKQLCIMHVFDCSCRILLVFILHKTKATVFPSGMIHWDVDILCVCKRMHMNMSYERVYLHSCMHGMCTCAHACISAGESVLAGKHVSKWACSDMRLNGLEPLQYQDFQVFARIMQAGVSLSNVGHN